MYWMLPATSSIAAGPAPRKGTWMPSVPVSWWNHTPERCGDCPTPGEPKECRPGLAFSQATNSGTVVAGTEGCTTSTFGPRIMLQTGARLVGW